MYPKNRPLRRRATPLAISLSALAALSLNACGSASSSPTPSASENSPKLSISQPWVKIPKPAEGEAMTGAFGTIENKTDTDVTIVGGESSIAKMVELHETVPNKEGGMKMQRKEGGFVVPAHGSFKLEPGKNHIMLMKIKDKDAIQAGKEVPVTLKLADGGTFEFTGQAKDFAGGNENYSE